MAPSTRSAGSTVSSAGRRQVYSTAMTPRKETAFRTKVQPGPAVATIKPPSAGPAARAMLKPMLPSAMAPGSSGRGTSSGMIACHAGLLAAAPRPSRKVKPSSHQGVIQPARVSTPRPAAATVIQPWVTSSNRRRSITSASAPAGSARKNDGRLVAACTSATSVVDVVNDVIIQEAPTFCSQVPTLEATVAIHSQRKSRCRSGLQAESGAAPVPAPGLAPVSAPASAPARAGAAARPAASALVGSMSARAPLMQTALLAAEHPARRRGYLASWPQSSAPPPAAAARRQCWMLELEELVEVEEVEDAAGCTAGPVKTTTGCRLAAAKAMPISPPAMTTSTPPMNAPSLKKGSLQW